MTRSRLVARNILASMATQLITWTLAFTVMIYLPRYVGAVGLGKLAFATSFVGMFGVLVPLGTSSVLTRDIARDRSRTGELLLTALMLRIPLAIVIAGLVNLIAYMMGYPSITRVLIAIVSLGMIGITANEAMSSALIGLENFPRQSAALLVEKCLLSGLTIALVFARAPLWALAAVGLVSSTVAVAINLTAFKDHWPRWRWPTVASLRALAIAGIPFVGWYAFRTLYGQTEPVVLNFVTNDKTVGWYAASDRLTAITLQVPWVLCTAFYPTLARLHTENFADFQRMARRLLALTMLIGVPIAVIFLCIPERLLALMHYPHEFAGSIPVLRIAGICVFLYYAGGALGMTVIASDGQKKMMRASLMACVFGIPTCFLCSYVAHRLWGNGAIGAVLSDALIEICMVVAYLRMLPSTLFYWESFSLVSRYVMAALPMAVCLLWISQTKTAIWAVLECVPIYALLCWLLRCFDPEALALIRSVFARKMKA